MLNLTHVRAFLAVVEEGSFHGAADQLGVSQSTVSHGLKRLEDMLASDLVIRHRDGCVPSHKGEIFLPFARSLVALSERAVARLQSDRIRIGASSNVGIYLLQPHLRRLADTAGVQPDLVIAANPAIATKLENREIDMAFLEWWDGRPGFEARRWITDRLLIIVAPDHPWARRNEIDLEMLLQQPLLAGEKGTGTGTILKEALGTAASRLLVSRNLGSTEAVKRAVAAGMGVSIVMEGAVRDEIASGRLYSVSVAGLRLEKTLWCVVPHDLITVSPTLETMRHLLEPQALSS
ncbi:MAG: LysR family transcriptional regulator [Aurantimonas endophytica]|uniref:LysR family transcriptional regulator n=1 Tax=Aurantimonas endophytica TaxID=1522175 RepID=UPI0030030CB5